MNRKLLVLLFILYFPVYIFAEIITLKSGKTVEGKIIERTDKYAKMDFMGVPITYYNDEIDSISRSKLPSPSNKVGQKIKPKNTLLTVVESSQQNNVDYEVWIKKPEIASYLDKLRYIGYEHSKALEPLIGVVAKNNPQEAMRAMEVMRSVVSSELADLRSLNPPPDFQNYHKKFIEVLSYMNDLYDGSIEINIGNVEKYKDIISKSSREAWEMLKAIYIRHRAPQSEIDAINMAIKGEFK